MDMDSKGAIYVIPRVYSNNVDQLAQKALSLLIGRNNTGNIVAQAGFVLIPGTHSFNGIQVIRRDIPSLDLMENDLLIFVNNRETPNDSSRQSLIAYKQHQRTFVPVFETVASFSTTIGDDFTIGPDGLVYLFSVTDARIVRLNEQHEVEEFAQIGRAARKNWDVATIGHVKTQIEYWPADRAFYILWDNGESLLRVSKDGDEIKEMMQEGHKLRHIKVSPDGYTFYVIYEERTFPIDIGTIQAINRMEDIPSGLSISALEQGDFDADGQVDENDVRQMIDRFVQPQSLTPLDGIFMDYNRDGRITPQDVQEYWMKYIHSN